MHKALIKDALFVILMALLVVTVCPPTLATDKEKSAQPSDVTGKPPPVKPLPASRAPVQWKTLTKNSLFLVGVMQSFRLAPEGGTREALHNSVFGGYLKALGSMHGWSDGDGYYENYLGHPIQGAVTDYVWIHNDPRYRNVEFGKSRDYWMGRLRAYGYSWAFSEQFEVGLLSEASIGQIQRYCCAYGFVDHVVTPNFGMVWLVGGDIIDSTLPVHSKIAPPALRLAAFFGHSSILPRPLPIL
jgi:hypothetical protein